VQVRTDGQESRVRTVASATAVLTNY